MNSNELYVEWILIFSIVINLAEILLENNES